MTWIKNPDDLDYPLYPQDFQCDFLIDKRAHLFLAGGWGSGKSFALLCKIADLCFSNPRNTRGAVIFPTGPLLSKFLRTQFMPSFRHLIKYYNKQENVAVMQEGREIYFLSAFEPARLEQLTLAWAVGDEAGLWEPEVFMRMVARVRDQRATTLQKVICGIPWTGWLPKEFPTGIDTSKRKIYHLATKNNTKLHPEYMSDLIASCPARMLKCYLEGQYVTPGGTVYPEWDESKHIIEWRDNKSLDTFVAIDWSPRTPHLIWFQLLPEGTVINGKVLTKLSQSHKWAAMIIVDEVVPDGTEGVTTDRLLLMTRERNWPLNYFCPDPAGRNLEATGGIDQITKTIQTLGIKPVMRMDSAGRSIINGVEHIKTLLEPIDGIPRLYLSKSVADRGRALSKHLRGRATVNAVPAYSYAVEKQGHPVDSNPVKDGISDHACDLIRLAAVNHFPIARLQVTGRSTL